MPVESVTLPDGRVVKLGRIPSSPPPQAPRLARYLRAAGPPPPPTVDYGSKAKTAIARMYCNDQLGCCVISGKMHQLGLWSGNDKDSGGVVLADDDEVRQQYRSICGPGDRGCIITDVLDSFQRNGLKAGGKTYTIDGYVVVDPRNKTELQVALLLFGSLTFGIDLPSEWANAPEGGLWDVTRSGIVGGHDVCGFGYDDKGVQIATWGGVRTITWAALASGRWVTEAYAQLAPLWYGADKMSPANVDVEALKRDLDILKNGGVPDLPPLTPPTPIPPVPPIPPTPLPPFPSPNDILSIITSLLKVLGPLALPMIEAWLSTLHLPVWLLPLLEAVISVLLGGNGQKYRKYKFPLDARGRVKAPACEACASSSEPAPPAPAPPPEKKK